MEASLNPTKHNYYYFEADKNNKTYFNETYNGHLNTIERLEREGDLPLQVRCDVDTVNQALGLLQQ